MNAATPALLVWSVVDAVAASGTIGAENDGPRATGCALLSCSDLRMPRVCGPACDGRASSRLSPALTPGLRRRRRRLVWDACDVAAWLEAQRETPKVA